jgi:hypothetical protein
MVLAAALFALLAPVAEVRSWGVFAAIVLIPQPLLLWLWNERRPAGVGTLRMDRRL